MEVSRNSVVETRKWTGLGRCRHFFWLGVVFDTVGVAVLLAGVFTDLLFYDLLLYLGSIIFFFSLLWWVFWYTCNIELIPDEALQGLYHVPSAIVVNALNQTGSPSLTFTIRSFSANLGQLRPGRLCRRLFQRTPGLLNMTLTGQVEKQLAKDDQDKGGVRNVKESGDAEGFGREDLGPEQETAKSPEGVCAPGWTATHLMQPEFTPSPLDRPLPLAILASKSLPVVSLSSTSQPPAILYSKSLSIVSLASVSQPPIPLASTNLPAVPLPFKGQPVNILASEIQTGAAPVVSQSLPLVPLASQNHSLSPVTSQIHPLVSVAAQSHFQVPVASESDFQNLSPASQTQPPAVQAVQAQALATQVFPIQLMPAPFFQNQSSDQWVTLAVQDTLHDTQQAPKSGALVEEIALSQSSHAQESQAGQELSQEVPDTVSQLPTSLALATEAQQSMPHESVAPCPTAENGHLP